MIWNYCIWADLFKIINVINHLGCFCFHNGFGFMVWLNQCRDLFLRIFVRIVLVAICLQKIIAITLACFLLVLKPNMRPIWKPVPNSNEECFKSLNRFRQFRLFGDCHCYKRIALCVARKVECVWLGWCGCFHQRSIDQIKFNASQILGLTTKKSHP